MAGGVVSGGGGLDQQSAHAPLPALPESSAAADQGSSAVSSISRSTDAILVAVSAALKRVPGPDYGDDEVSTQALSRSIFPPLPT